MDLVITCFHCIIHLCFSANSYTAKEKVLINKYFINAIDCAKFVN